MYCNFNVDYVLDSILNIKYVKDARIIENDEYLIVALVTEPIFNKSEINQVLLNVTATARLLADKEVIVTRSMEIFCDIDNNQKGYKNAPKFNDILKKVKNNIV